MDAQELQNQIRDAASACNRLAIECDKAFMKHADARAIQGGAIDEEAKQWRTRARKLNEIANGIDF